MMERTVRDLMPGDVLTGSQEIIVAISPLSSTSMKVKLDHPSNRGNTRTTYWPPEMTVNVDA